MEPVVERALQLKEGVITNPIIGGPASNVKDQIIDTQIVDQYTIYGSNILKRVLR